MSNSKPADKSHRPDQLLYSREQAAELLGGVSGNYIRRLEQQGRLRPIRLSRSPTGMVFFRASDLQALIEEAAEA
jgi:hypothetical protein